MNKKAIISVSSSKGNGEDDDIEVVTPGVFKIEEEYFKAEYDETEISGMEGTKTFLFIKKDSLKLKREGTTNTEMEFINRKDTVSLYSTPYGMLELRIHTKELDININENGGDIFIKYNISIEGQDPQLTELKISIKAN